MRDEYLRNGGLVRLRFAERSVDRVEIPQLEVAGWADAEELVERFAQCSFGYLGRSHELLDGDVVAFLEDTLGPADDLCSG
jgi:hypothetical protein